MDMKDTIQRRIRAGRKILFSKDDEIIRELQAVIDAMPKKAIILWALEMAKESVRQLERKYPEDLRPRMALVLSRQWAEGKVKMPVAKRAILDCHAMAKELEDRADSARCHAVGQACSCVHTVKHAIGYPVYDLTAVVCEHEEENCDEIISERLQYYRERLQYHSIHYSDEEREWAVFLGE